MSIYKCYLVDNDCYKANKTIVPRGIIVHSTGANNKALKRYVQPSKTMNTTARQEAIKLLGVNSYNNHWNRSGISKCVHAFVGTTASGAVATIQTLPWTMRAWGCGAGPNGSYNNSHIQFEICEDNLVDTAYFNKVYKEATELCDYLCKMYGLGVNSVVSHAESHRAGYGSNHADPEHWFKKHNKTMNDFRSDVAKLLGSSSYLIRVAAASLNVRSGPSVNYKVVEVIKANEVYTIVDEQNGWGKLKSGVGWINLKYTTHVTRS